MSTPDHEQNRLTAIKQFYERQYYADAKPVCKTTLHYRALAKKLKITRHQRVLDVACGTGQWLYTVSQQGALPHGVDLSDTAINLCKSTMPHGHFHACPAERLPFTDQQFDIVTCLGSLEHFVDPAAALAEMSRVAKDQAQFVLLVPNADFLTRKLGFYKGTAQTAAKEDVRTLTEWQRLFENNGFSVVDKWKDLHVLNRHWIAAGCWYTRPIRLLQALALLFWPLKWQYQVYHGCIKSERN